MQHQWFYVISDIAYHSILALSNQFFFFFSYSSCFLTEFCSLLSLVIHSIILNKLVCMCVCVHFFILFFVYSPLVNGIFKVWSDFRSLCHWNRYVGFFLYIYSIYENWWYNRLCNKKRYITTHSSIHEDILVWIWKMESIIWNGILGKVTDFTEWPPQIREGEKMKENYEYKLG